MQTKLIENPQQLEAAFSIRQKVFVEEQMVDPAEEYDEYETTCRHYLVSENGNPIGTCRIRSTEKGYKLERFAVLKEHRGKHAGAALVNACLADEWLQQTGTYVYMHAQEHAIGFYSRFGFKTKGERFMECDIPHFTMYQIVGEAS